MKKMLTIVACGRNTELEQLNELSDVELIYTEKGESDLPEAIKQSKGKYTVILPAYCEISDIKSLLSAVNENNEDVISFGLNCAFKTALFKGLNFKENNSVFLMRIFAAMEAKSLIKMQYAPFKCLLTEEVFDERTQSEIIIAEEQFVKVKAKLQKEVYNYIFDMLVDKLVVFYMCALLKIRQGEYEREKLIEFDNRLKGEIVLYLALKKRFTVCDLQKIRDNNFKVSYFTAKKLKKQITK